MLDEDVRLMLAFRDGDDAAFDALFERWAARLLRFLERMVRDEAVAEELVQETFLLVHRARASYAPEARFSTWLTRIAVHEASARRRRRGRQTDIEESMPTLASTAAGPEQRAADHELGYAIEAAVGALPEVYRSVFMLREVEGLSTAETAACLDINAETVKTRLHRARALLRNHITARIGVAAPETFQFAGARCDRTVAAVMARITSLPARPL